MHTSRGSKQAPTSRPTRAVPPSRRERQKAETRECLYRAALKLFAERGLAATTVEDITKAAGVAKGTFFNHFRAKEEVFSVFIEIQVAKVASAVQNARQARDSTKAVLHQLFRRLAEEFGRDATLTRALLSSIFLNETAREVMAQGMARARQALTKVIAPGQERGDIRTDRKADAIALAFQRAMLGTVVVWAVRAEGRLSSRLDVSFGDFWAAVAPHVKK